MQFVAGALLVLVPLVRPGPLLVGATLVGLGAGWIDFRRLGAIDATSTSDLLTFAMTAVLAAAAAGVVSVRHDRLRQALHQARQQHEALRVTLASIGDAVITTDASGRINFVNAVAEQVTGWSRQQADALPVEQVFRVVDEADRRPLLDPVRQVLRDGQVVGMAGNPLLIRRDGSELPIDEIAAPIRSDDGSVSGVVLVFRDIGQRRIAELGLQRSERELASFFEHASLGMVWVGPDGTVLRANQAQLQLLGVNEQDYVGRPFAGFHLDGDPMAEILAPLARGEALSERTARLRHADGSVRDVLLRCNALFEDGRFVHARCFVQDVTERLRAEHAQRESEGRFRTMADSAPVLIWMAGPDTMCQWFNRPWLEFTGRTLEREVGQGWTEGLHPADRERTLSTYRSAFDARQPFSIDYRLRRHDGEYRWLLVSGVPRLDAAGQLEGFVGSGLDITARKAAEAALARSEAMFRGLADANLIGVGFGDTLGGTTYLNDEMLRMMGRTRAEFEAGGFNWANCVAPEFAHLHEAWRRRLLADGRVGGYERAFLRPDGGRTPYVGAAALLEPGSDFHVRIALDLTRVRQAEEGRRELVAQLREADHRKDEFLATLAHELRNPLAPAIHSLELMRRAEGEPLLQERSRATIERQLQHMVRLIDDLLDVSRITRDRLELRRSRVELRSVLEQALEAGRPVLTAAGQALHLSEPGRPLWLDADPVRLVQVFSNLLGNASKYSPAGRPIGVDLRAVGGRAEVTFRDQGIGIAPDMLHQVFEMFVQGEQPPGGPQGGLGIGLTLARRLVELHGGELTASSPGRGKGSVFVVSLPLQEAAPVADPPALAGPGAATVAQAQAQRRMLVVDDNHDAAAVLALLLELGGHSVRIAHDGLQALAVAERFRPEVVLLDIGLPLLDGHEVARRLRAQPWARPLVLVALTGWGQESDRQASKGAGFDAHLVKPVEHEALMHLLAQLLERPAPTA